MSRLCLAISLKSVTIEKVMRVIGIDRLIRSTALTYCGLFSGFSLFTQHTMSQRSSYSLPTSRMSRWIQDTHRCLSASASQPRFIQNCPWVSLQSWTDWSRRRTGILQLSRRPRTTHPSRTQDCPFTIQTSHSSERSRSNSSLESTPLPYVPKLAIAFKHWDVPLNLHKLTCWPLF